MSSSLILLYSRAKPVFPFTPEKNTTSTQQQWTCIPQAPQTPQAATTVNMWVGSKSKREEHPFWKPYLLSNSELFCFTESKHTFSSIHCKSYSKTTSHPSSSTWSSQKSSSFSSSYTSHYGPAKFAWSPQPLAVPSAGFLSWCPFFFSWRWSTSRSQQGPGEGSEPEVSIG